MNEESIAHKLTITWSSVFITDGSNHEYMSAEVNMEPVTSLSSTQDARWFVLLRSQIESAMCPPPKWADFTWYNSWLPQGNRSNPLRSITSKSRKSLQRYFGRTQLGRGPSTYNNKYHRFRDCVEKWSFETPSLISCNVYNQSNLLNDGIWKFAGFKVSSRWLLSNFFRVHIYLFESIAFTALEGPIIE